MKANRLYIFSLCAIAGLSLYACGDDDSKSCEKTSECGDANEWKCDIDTSTCVRLFPEHCTNGKTDSGETDSDCGGTCANADVKKKLTCGLGKVCKVNGDCGSGKCEAGKCVTAGCNDLGACDDTSLTCDRATMTCISCNDKTKNGDETDVDCGGSKCDPCAAGKVCKDNGDCALGLCEGGKCSSTETVNAETGDLIINEFMANSDGTTDPTKAKTFPYNDHAKQCKFVEIVNISKKRIKVDDCTLFIEKLDENGDPIEGKNSTTKLEGTLSSKGVIVVTESACKDISYAPGTIVLSLASPANITKKDDYVAEVYCGEMTEDPTPLGRVGIWGSEAGISMNRPEDMKLLESDDGKKMVPHTSAKGAFSFSYASPSFCANGGLFSQDCKTECGDGALNRDETDVDCGGSFCGPCTVGKKCGKPTDCDTNMCEGGKCVAPKCSATTKCEGELVCNLDTGVCEGCGDGVLNGDETDTDCGGSCSQKCKKEEKCKIGADCETGQCGTDGKCAGDKPNAATVDDLVINEVMGSPSSSSEFTKPAVKQCEFVEIVNKTDNPLSLENRKLNLKKEGDASAKEIEIKDMIIAAKSAGVVGECDSKLGPDDVSYKKVSLGMTNKYAYELWLSSSDKDGEVVTRAAKGTATGESQGRNPDVTGTSLEFGKATPGYCRNGGLFSQNCAVDCGNGTESCGGTCSEKCGEGAHCNENSDCASDACENNQCAGGVDPSVLIINEIFDSGSSSPAFSAINGEGKACEFIEIANPTDKEVKVSNIKLMLEGTNSTGKTSEIDLTPAGAIPSKHLLVIHNCDESLKLPSDAISLKVDISKILTGTWTYDISLVSGDVKSTQIKGLAISSVVNSSYNRDPDFAPNGAEPATMVKTTGVEGYAHYATPGFCLNGKSYSSGCVEDPNVAE